MSESLALIKDMLQPVGDVSHRRMFGGYGLFWDGLMFGLMADDVLYLKVDDGNRADFDAAGLPPFSYQRQGKSIQLSYCQAPVDVFEDSDLASVWATKAFAAALRSRKVPPAKSSAKKPVNKR